jgi:ABC-2 type transport system ATP-binding protein
VSASPAPPRPRADDPSAAPAIAVRGLVKRYGDTVAVDGLDLTVAVGETFALLGPNGAGKTSTIECCEGYRRPDGGTVRVLGFDPRRDARRLRPRVGLMLQEGGVYPLARPAEVLELFAAFHRDPLDPAELLDRVGLDGARRTRFRDLSGGQKQRLALALAVVGRPDVVFLDEPTAGLDVASRRDTWEHVRELRTQGVTVVLSTHLLDEAEELADRVAIVDHGRLVALGTPDELTHGAHEELEFTAAPRLDLTGLAAAVGAPVTEPRPGRYTVHAATTPARVARLAGWLEDADVVLGELKAGKRSLEDVFLRLTSEPERTATAGRASRGR